MAQNNKNQIGKSRKSKELIDKTLIKVELWTSRLTCTNPNNWGELIR